MKNFVGKACVAFCVLAGIAGSVFALSRTIGVGASTVAQKINGMNNLRIPQQNWPDPSIIKVGDEYLVYFTRCAGIGMVKTTDFENFSEVKEVVKNDGSFYRCHWAPEVYEHNSKYAITYTGAANQNDKPASERVFDIFVGVSNSPEGGFETWKIDLGEIGNAIDSHIFFDDDGKIYLYVKQERQGQNGVGTKFFVAEMNPDLKSIKKETITEILEVIPGWSNDTKKDWERSLIEGPFVIKKDGVYYLSYTSGNFSNETYVVAYATSSSPYGKFTRQNVNGGAPLLHSVYPENGVYDSKNNLYGTGHHSFIKISDDEWFIAYHSALFENNKYFGWRKSNIDRLVFSNGRMLVNGPSTTDQPLPSSGGRELMVSGEYKVKANNAERPFLSDTLNFNAENSAKNVDATPIVAVQNISTSQVLLESTISKGFSEIWLFTDGVETFGGVTATVVADGESSTISLGSGKSAGISIKNYPVNVSIAFSKEIKLSEVQAFGVPVKYERRTQETVIPYKAERVANDKLPVGSEVVKRPGVDGKNITQTNYMVNLHTGEERKVMSNNRIEDPVDEIVEYGTGENVSIPFETRYEADYDMEVGQQKVSVEGENGEKDVAGKILKNAITKVVKVGAKSTTREVDFEKKTVEDEALPLTYHEVTTTGEKGIETTTYTVDVKTGVVISSVKITKQPVVEIITVGTGKNEEIDFETIYEDDEDLEAGRQIIAQEGKKGLKDVTGKVLEEATPEIVKVGTKKPVVLSVNDLSDDISKNGYTFENSKKIESPNTGFVQYGAMIAASAVLLASVTIFIKK